MPQHSSLARLLQWLLLAQLGPAMGWLLWRWPSSPAQAVAGTMLVLLMSPLVLAIELVLVSRVGRSDVDVPSPTATELLRAGACETAHFFATFWWRMPFRWRAAADHLGADTAGRTGVVLVHGFMCNRGFWMRWLRMLRSRGRACIAVNLEPVSGPIDAYAATIDSAVRRVTELTGRAPLVVAHSMGGLAVRAWWRASPAACAVAHVVTIGTPHHGTWLARFSSRPNGRQMRMDSHWLLRLAQDEAQRPLPPTTCWYSNCDNVVFPASTATLAPAVNRFIAGKAHVELAFHPDVFAACLQTLEELDRCQGESVTGIPSENG